MRAKTNLKKLEKWLDLSVKLTFSKEFLNIEVSVSETFSRNLFYDHNVHIKFLNEFFFLGELLLIYNWRSPQLQHIHVKQLLIAIATNNIFQGNIIRICTIITRQCLLRFLRVLIRNTSYNLISCNQRHQNWITLWIWMKAN